MQFFDYYVYEYLAAFKNLLLNQNYVLGTALSRSLSQESTHTDSKEEQPLTSISASRPSRKTKEAAKSYLNLLGQKLAGKKRDEETEVRFIFCQEQF